MSKWWIQLNDIRVNCAAQTEGDVLAVVWALGFLYLNAGAIDDPFDEEEWNT